MFEGTHTIIFIEPYVLELVVHVAFDVPPSPSGAPPLLLVLEPPLLLLLLDVVGGSPSAFGDVPSAEKPRVSRDPGSEQAATRIIDASTSELRHAMNGRMGMPRAGGAHGRFPAFCRIARQSRRTSKTILRVSGGAGV